MENNKILIVEDNLDLIESYEMIFKKEWFDVQIAYDWLEAEKRFKSFSPDLILLDIMMPKVNWFSFLEKIRKNNKDVLIILNSNLSQDSDVEKWYELWANEYLRKSDYNVFELVEKVKEIIEK